MNLSQALTLSRQLNYADQSKLYAYFDAITFVDSVETFLVATHKYLANLTSSDEDQAFATLLYQSIILPIVQSRATSKVSFQSSDALVSQDIPSLSSNFAPVLSVSKQKCQAVSAVSYYLPMLHEYKTPVKDNYGIDFYDDFYQGLYLNHWQDENYIHEFLVDDWLNDNDWG